MNHKYYMEGQLQESKILSETKQSKGFNNQIFRNRQWIGMIKGGHVLIGRLIINIFNNVFAILNSPFNLSSLFT